MSKPHPLDHDQPSPETLAGVYVCMEGREQVLVVPKKNSAAATAASASQAESKKTAGVKPHAHQAKKRR